MEELKPCPFCGSGRVNVIEHKFHHLINSFGVKCFNCKTESYQFFDSRKETIEAWNRRASDERRKESGLLQLPTLHQEPG